MIEESKLLNTRTSLDSLIPSDADQVRSLIGQIDSTFRGKPIDDAASFPAAIICKKAFHEIEIELSDIKCLPYEQEMKTSIQCVGILAKAPLGRLYSDENSADELSADPFILAEIELSSSGSGSFVDSSQGDILEVALVLGSQSFQHVADTLLMEPYARLHVNLELWQSDENKYYVRPGRDAIRNFELVFLNDTPQLDFSLDELAAAILCKRSGNKLSVDEGSVKVMPQNMLLFTSIITFLEVVAGIMFIYQNLH